MLSPFHASQLGWGWLRCRLSIHKGITTLNQRSPARRSATRKGKLLCLAVGVIISLMVLPYTFQPFILLRVTPTANRNSYRVAMLVGQLPRVAAFARNPGLGKRNSYRVAAACGILVCIIPHVAAACGLPVYSCFCTGDRRTFCFCGFSACRQAGADGDGGEWPRACSRRHCRQPQTQRAQP